MIRQIIAVGGRCLQFKWVAIAIIVAVATVVETKTQIRLIHRVAELWAGLVDAIAVIAHCAPASSKCRSRARGFDETDGRVRRVDRDNFYDDVGSRARAANGAGICSAVAVASARQYYQQHPAEFQQLFNSLPSVSPEIWRDTAGNVSIWLMNGTQVLQATVLGTVPLTWTIAQTGDFGWRSQERHSPAGMSPSG